MQCKERARVEMGHGEDQTESTFAFAGVAIATEETLTPVWHNIRESSTSRKGTKGAAGKVRT